MNLTTDKEYDQLFTSIIEEYKPKTFVELEQKVAELFKTKLDEKLASWGERIKIDRTRLKELFKIS